MVNVPHKVLSANMIYGHVQTQPVSATKRNLKYQYLQLLIQNHTKKNSSMPFHTATKRAQRNPLWCIYYTFINATHSEIKNEPSWVKIL